MSDVPNTFIPDVPGHIDPTPVPDPVDTAPVVQEKVGGKIFFAPGNTFGYNKGHRSKMGGSFLHALHLSFMEADEKGTPKGLVAIREMRNRHPAKYVAALMDLLPKELVAADPNGHLTGIAVTFVRPPPEIDAKPVFTSARPGRTNEVN